MGRVKLKIKRLESTSNRQVTYSKRRSGILKKARELSILCDIDIILLMFSPTEKPTLFTGERSTVEEVVAKFAQLTPQERTKKKLESLETLKKTFKKFDHDVVIQDFLGSSNQSVEELTDRVALMQAQLTDLHRRLSYWRNVDQINNVDHLGQMEASLRESINRINVHKENLRNSQVLPLDCGDQVQQFQSGMSLPLMMSATQETQPVPWLPNNGQQLMPIDSAKIFTHSVAECSADVPLPSFTEYFGTGKQTEIGNSGSLDNIAQEGGSLSELSNSGCLNLQPNDQFLYPSNGSLNIPENKTLKAEMEMHLKGSHDVYQVGNNFELPRPVFHDGHLPWMPASGSCGIAMNNWNSFHQH